MPGWTKKKKLLGAELNRQSSSCWVKPHGTKQTVFENRGFIEILFCDILHQTFSTLCSHKQFHYIFLINFNSVFQVKHSFAAIGDTAW